MTHLLPSRFSLLAWNQLSTVIGGVLWLLMALVRLRNSIALDGPELLLLLAFFVITPLVLRLLVCTSTPRFPGKIDHAAMIMQPFAALIGGASFLIGSGLIAATLAGIWLAFTGLVALQGMTLIFRRGSCGIADACLAVALIYLPIGGAWFVMARLNMQFLGFSQDTVLFTAAHFHYIPLAALTLTGLTGQALQGNQRRLSWYAYRVVALGMIAYPPLVALGITLTQLTNSRFIETVAAILLAFNVMLLSALSLRFVVPQTASRLGKGFLAISSSAVLLSMSFAGAYALGNATGAWTITASQMIVAHGWVNALAFGFCGLVGWYIKQAE